MNNQLQVIVKESGLEQTKANFILEKFQGYFAIADEWTQKAKTIIVTNESQTADMLMARVGRLFLKDKRIAVENSRKELKEQSLREGKAIDGIANVLKALIIPIEDYLDQQEHFVEIKKKQEEDEKRREIERRIEDERLAEEEEKRKEQERIRLENIKLQKEVEEREKQMRKEREAAETKQKAIEEKARKEREELERASKVAWEKAETEKRVIEEKARQERELEQKKHDKELADERVKAEIERKKIEEKARVEREKALKNRIKAEAKMASAKKKQEILKQKLAKEIECPFCHKRFNLNQKRVMK